MASLAQAPKSLEKSYTFWCPAPNQLVLTQIASKTSPMQLNVSGKTVGQASYVIKGTMDVNNKVVSFESAQWSADSWGMSCSYKTQNRDTQQKGLLMLFTRSVIKHNCGFTPSSSDNQDVCIQSVASKCKLKCNVN